ncbi:NADH-quinone oxidoreductase subunit J [candidate division KSB3 bacterium]|uniref:NADH-quinone oxidoreductase subunit J n=1 Tax=candidate division KSB3 bacterium TaxID=2044937 RepID=A0A2G6E0D4_9BACT|nr:MAG: NADH-quinone oxidoreductase subunit J [candidate division KSB3 bacterium]
MNSFLTADNMAGMVFVIMSSLTILGALIATCTERPVRAIAGLALCFTSLAAVYFFLNSPFVAAMQILIYVGAVSVTISFAIMLAPPESRKHERKVHRWAVPAGAVTALLLAGTLITIGIKTQWQATPKVNNGSIELLGIKLLTEFSMLFELISILLLIAIIGAIVLARGGRQ